MADYPDIKVDALAWVSLHAAHGITPGTQIFVQNTGNHTGRMALGAVAPTPLLSFGLRVPVFDVNDPESKLVQSTPVGAGDESWVICEAGGKTTFSVQDAT